MKVSSREKVKTMAEDSFVSAEELSMSKTEHSWGTRAI